MNRQRGDRCAVGEIALLGSLALLSFALRRAMIRGFHALPSAFDGLGQLLHALLRERLIGFVAETSRR